MAALGGVGAALILLAMPVRVVELVVASSGISESVPAAAPPLGVKARLLLAGFGALMVIGLVWAGRLEKGATAPQRTGFGRADRVPGVSRMGFALSKLGWLSRSRNGAAARGGRPALRRADAHPDAPVRSPIFASRDFGGLDIFPTAAPVRPTAMEAEEASVVLSLPRMVPPVPEEVIEAVAADRDIAPPAAPVAAAPVEEAPPRAQTLSELTARLERGLARRERGTRGGTVLADMPIEPAVPVRAKVEDDVDEALRAALSTLRAMASRTR